MMRLPLERVRSIVGGHWLNPPKRGDLIVAGVGINSRESLEGQAFIAISGKRYDGHDFLAGARDRGAALLIVEQATPHIHDVPTLRVASTRGALAVLASDYRNQLQQMHVIAITGSVGKTTTKTILDGLLATQLKGTAAVKSFNNDIGVPLTVLRASPTDDYLIVEIGTNAPGEIDALAAIVRPTIGVITSVGRAHLAGLGSLEGVIGEKGALLRHLTTNGLAVIPAGVDELQRVAGQSRIMLFGDDPDADPRLTAYRCAGDRAFFEVNGVHEYESAIPGRHHAMNAMIAIAIARKIGISDTIIRQTLTEISPPPMRMERIESGGVVFWHDAYNANPESMHAALDTFAELTPLSTRRILILGDMLELGLASDRLHEDVGAHVRDIHVQTPLAQVVLVGSYAQAMWRGMEDALAAPCVSVFSELDTAAIRDIRNGFRPGDAVLLKGSRGMALDRLLEQGMACGHAPIA